MFMQPVLFVLSSYRPGENAAAGFRFEELSIPYFILQDEGIMVELASPGGGVAHPDPASHDGKNNRCNPATVNRFINDLEAMYKLHNTRPLSDYEMEDYAALHLVGESFRTVSEQDNDLYRLIAAARAQEKMISYGAAPASGAGTQLLAAVGLNMCDYVRGIRQGPAVIPPAGTGMDAVASVFSHNLSL